MGCLLLRCDVPHFGDVVRIHIFTVGARFLFAQPINVFGVWEQMVFANIRAVTPIPYDELIDGGVCLMNKFGWKPCLIVVASGFVIQKN